MKGFVTSLTLRATVVTATALVFQMNAVSADVDFKEVIARRAMTVFSDNCFSPYLTAEKAARLFVGPRTYAGFGLNYDFYDLAPFSSVAPSPATGRAVTPGTDRRCEISFPGDYSEKAAQAVAESLASEGITTLAELPAAFTPTDTTTLLEARRLNPRRLAIVHVGTRGDAYLKETFMLVERLTPTDPVN